MHILHLIVAESYIRNLLINNHTLTAALGLQLHGQTGYKDLFVPATQHCLLLLQLVANAVLFTSVNLSGVFVRILTERTQRKVFLQARNCIQERLRLEDENEKQVHAVL